MKRRHSKPPCSLCNRSKMTSKTTWPHAKSTNQEKELTRQSTYSRRWNLLLFKFNETEGKNCCQNVKDVFKDKNMPCHCTEFIGLGKYTTNSQERFLSISPARQTGTTFGAKTVFLQSLTSESGKTCNSHNVLIPALKKF